MDTEAATYSDEDVPTEYDIADASFGATFGNQGLETGLIKYGDGNVEKESEGASVDQDEAFLD